MNIFLLLDPFWFLGSVDFNVWPSMSVFSDLLSTWHQWFPLTCDASMLIVKLKFSYFFPPSLWFFDWFLLRYGIWQNLFPKKCLEEFLPGNTSASQFIHPTSYMPIQTSTWYRSATGFVKRSNMLNVGLYQDESENWKMSNCRW